MSAARRRRGGWGCSSVSSLAHRTSLGWLPDPITSSSFMSHRLLLTPSAELMRLEEKEGSLFHRPSNNCRANRSHHYHHSSPSSAAATTTAARQLHALHSLVVGEPGATEEDDERVKLIRARPNMQTMNLMLESSIFVWPLCAFLPLADISPRLRSPTLCSVC